MIGYAYRDKTAKGLVFPHHIVLYNESNVWDVEYRVVLNAERQRLCRNALRTVGVEGKNWSLEELWDNEFGRSLIFMFREGSHATLFRLMI